MPRVITKTHQWVVAVWVDVDEKQAKWAATRGNVVISEPTKADACDIICVMCRRRYEDIVDVPCPAAVDNTHLRGGHADGSRKRRTKAAANE